MQSSCYFLRNKHLLRKFPLRANEDRGQFMSGAIRGYYLSPLALQSIWECFLCIKYTKHGESVAFPHCFSSREVSQLCCHPGHPRRPARSTRLGADGLVGALAAVAQQGKNTGIIIPLSSRANEQLTLPRTAFSVSPEV